MAESYSHKWGQIIGNLIQEFIRETLQEVALAHGFYLDYSPPETLREQKKRACRISKKVSWQDRYGNFDDLDYVLERGGDENTRGLPVAFIETAWRRYTKHSRNKAQEIEGALIPLSETYSNLNPFLGVILAGVFTKGALEQLESKKFKILYLKYENIVKAFEEVGINASFNESTPETEFQDKINSWNNLSAQDMAIIKTQLLSLEKPNIDTFVTEVNKSFSRRIQSVSIIVLHRLMQQLDSIENAIEYIQSYSTSQTMVAPILKYEVDIRYNNGDVIHAIFQDRAEAIKFLMTFA